MRIYKGNYGVVGNSIQIQRKILLEVEKIRSILSKSILSLCILVLFISITVKADSIALPTSYKIEIGNEKYVFVMLAKDSGKVLSKTNKEYPKSGLYENDGSVTPLWTIDWYQYKGMVFITDDGDYIASLGPWAALSPIGQLDLNQSAVSFYNRGTLIKEYYISDLVKNTFYLRKSASHFEWRDKVEFDGNAATFTVFTKDKHQYVFDIKNGNIITKNIKNTALKVKILIFVVGVLVLIFVLKIYRSKR